MHLCGMNGLASETDRGHRMDFLNLPATCGRPALPQLISTRRNPNGLTRGRARTTPAPSLLGGLQRFGPPS